MGWRYDEHKLRLAVLLKIRDRWAKAKSRHCIGGTNEDWYQWIIWWRARRDIIAAEIKTLHVERRAQQRREYERDINTKPSAASRAGTRQRDRRDHANWADAGTDIAMAGHYVADGMDLSGF